MDNLLTILGLCEGNTQVTDGVSLKMTNNAGFAYGYAVSLNKLLNKQLLFRRFEPMWCSRAVTVML